MGKLQGTSVRIMGSTLKIILLSVSFQILQVNVLSGASQVFVCDPQYSGNAMEQGN